MKKKVLFVCTHNSARSQMAEGFLRFLYGDFYEALSAGTEPTGLHPLAVKVMAEVGIDISQQKSKSVDEFLNQEIDLVITVCDSAKEKCPYFPFGKKRIHESFPDPASIEGSEQDKLEAFRQVRDQIKKWISETLSPPKLLNSETTG
ncbi:MAG: arsenate reductase ArsC [Candidatus Aminicenantes bacterium]|nr:arsenate reductase ArsC [Candidatus Aminicenantes bacterium]